MTVTDSVTSSVEQRPQGAQAKGGPREDVPNAQPVPWRFAFLAAQLAVLLFVIEGLNLNRGVLSVPLPLCVVAFLGFAVHYWTPFRHKKTVFVLLSFVGVFAAFGPDDWLTVGSRDFWVQMGGAASFLAATVVVGLFFYGCLRLPVPFGVRVAVVVAGGCGLAYGRANDLWLSGGEWAILGAIFMFRMIIYAAAVKASRQPETLTDFMCYFFLLPNLFFPLFPVIDYTTFKRRYYAYNIHESAQKGILWMVRGVTHMCIFRILYQREVASDQVQNVFTLILFVFQMYLQYLRVSGLFHFIAGMLHLFGWNLPETNSKFLLASSFTDFWRRMNIYWKDFMVNSFYYPVFFRLRKINERLALIVATVVVFAATTVLHGYQMFWIKGSFAIYARDYAFWGAFGALVLITVLYETRGGKPKKRSKPVALLIRVAKTLGVYITISVLWSIWSVPLAEWWDTVTYVFER
ncbi:MAG: hypothetical protein IID37_07855 [Planctomycetes bacterium]|nr:hypothetical protein [Planctomycetota bacterium]